MQQSTCFRVKFRSRTFYLPILYSQIGMPIYSVLFFILFMKQNSLLHVASRLIPCSKNIDFCAANLCSNLWVKWNRCIRLNQLMDIMKNWHCFVFNVHEMWLQLADLLFGLGCVVLFMDDFFSIIRLKRSSWITRIHWNTHFSKSIFLSHSTNNIL